MGLVAAEFLKLRRSRVGVFAVLLPLLATVAGAVIPSSSSTVGVTSQTLM